MHDRAFQIPSVSILVFVLLLVLPGLAAAGERPRLTPEARAAFEAVAPPQMASCNLCAVAHQHCSATCFSLAEKGEMGKGCLTACDNAAATCKCDGEVTLRSEDFSTVEWPSVTKAACHGNVSCQPNYPSCASWSSYASCGTPWCGVAHGCGEDCEFGPCPGPAWKEYLEAFRVCFDQFSNPCTEWVQTLIASCGC